MRWPENFKIVADEPAINNIKTYYKNVGLKFKNSRPRKDINKLISDTQQLIEKINRNKLISAPYLDRWKGLGRVVIGKWNFAIDIKGNTVYVVDACHSNNMHNQKEREEPEEEVEYTNPRITNIGIRHLPNTDNPYFIYCHIDGDYKWQQEMSNEDVRLHQAGKISLVKLAEKYFKKDLEEQRFDMDNFIGRKR